MRIGHRIGIAVVTAALAAGSGAGHAGAPPKHGTDAPVDAGLLEFLGSADPSSDATKPDGGAWLAYLSQVNIGKVAAASRAAPAPQASPQPKPAGTAAGAGKPPGG
jgi:hypothetical protein